MFQHLLDDSGFFKEQPEFLYPENEEAMLWLVAAKMRPFTKYDWDAYCGCEHRLPYYGEVRSDLVGTYCVVLDGNCLLLNHELDPFGGRQYWLSDRGSR